MAAAANPRYRWYDDDGDAGEVYDWHEDSPTDDSIEKPTAALRVGESDDDDEGRDDWSTVLLPKDNAVALIAWLTEFYGLA